LNRAEKKWQTARNDFGSDMLRTEIEAARIHVQNDRNK
jgi:hypothetical protein